MKSIVVALGGNALGNSPKEQLEAVKGSSKSIADIIETYDKVAVVHGNGPQVGVINLALSLAAKEDSTIPEFPLVECVAMSQGYIGYHLQQAIENELASRNIDKKVATVVTQVEVDPKDPAFENPTKPIGNFYTQEEADKIAKKDGYTFKEDAGRGFRRVVASPKPQRIVELDTVTNHLDNDGVVVTGGGGGIPVVKEEGNYKGVDAVIDKDKTSALLAAHLKSDQLIILTAVDYVYINYGKDNQEALGEVTVDEMNQHIADGQFAKGSMLPKVEAALQFIEKNPEGSVLITSLEDLGDALDGKIGTLIKK